MADVTITDRSRVVLSWGVLVALLTLVGTAVRTHAAVTDHDRRLSNIEAQASTTATKADIERLESRVIRIESLLLQQRTATGR